MANIVPAQADIGQLIVVHVQHRARFAPVAPQRNKPGQSMQDFLARDDSWIRGCDGKPVKGDDMAH